MASSSNYLKLLQLKDFITVTHFFSSFHLLFKPNKNYEKIKKIELKQRILRSMSSFSTHLRQSHIAKNLMVTHSNQIIILWRLLGVTNSLQSSHIKICWQKNYGNVRHFESNYKNAGWNFWMFRLSLIHNKRKLSSSSRQFTKQAFSPTHLPRKPAHH